MALDPHAAAIMVSTIAAAVLMMLSGLQKSALEWRHRRRICPSCGRDLRSHCACD
jgi:NADH pyrophosphatase NudC (nudix superfamily)